AAESFGNNAHDAVPKFLSDAFMNPAIAQHHELPARGNDEEKHAVAIFCAGHAQPDERLLGSLVDVAPKQSCNGNPDLPQGGVFRLLFGFFDLYVVDVPDNFFVCPHHDPLAPPPPALPPPPLTPPPPHPPPPPQSSRSRRPLPEKMLKRRSIARLGFVTNITRA